MPSERSRKGVLWETLAVPEIREQRSRCATHIDAGLRLEPIGPHVKLRRPGGLRVRLGFRRRAGPGRAARRAAPTRPSSTRGGDPRVERTAREVLRQPGPGDERHRSPALLRPILKQTVSYRYHRGRDVVAHGTGWVERIVVDARRLELLHADRDHDQRGLVRAPRVRDPPRPAARVHPRAGRRARRHRVRARWLRRATIGPGAPRQLEFDTSGYVQMELLGLEGTED